MSQPSPRSRLSKKVPEYRPQPSKRITHSNSDVCLHDHAETPDIFKPYLQKYLLLISSEKQESF